MLDRVPRAAYARRRCEGGQETILVDIASTDGTEAMLARHADEIREIRSDWNLGYAFGSNQVEAAATGEVLTS